MGEHFVYYFQLFAMSACVAISNYFFCKAICGTKHGIKGVLVLLGHWIYRFFFHELYYSVYLGRLYGDRDWFMNGYIFLHILQIVFFMLVMGYIFEGSLVKVLLTSFIAESIGTSIVVFGQLILMGSINLEHVSGVSASNLLKIIAGILVATVALWSIYRIFYSYMIRLQNYELKHIKLLGIFILLEYLVALITNISQDLIGRMDFTDFTIVMSYNLLLYLIVFIVVSGVIYIKRRRKQNELAQNMQIIHQWNETVQKEEAFLFSQQNDIDEVLEAVGQRQSGQERNEKLADYIHHLKEKYAKIQAGIYCGDRRMDAFLLTLQKEAEKRKVPLEISFQGYQGINFAGNPLEETLWIIFQHLCQLNDPAKESRIYLKVADVGAYTLLFFRLCGNVDSDKVWKKEIKKCRRQMSSSLKAHRGFMTAERKRDQSEVKVMMGK